MPRTKLRDFTPSLPPIHLSPFPSEITEHWSPIVSIGFNHPGREGVVHPSPPCYAIVRLLFSRDTSSWNLLRRREKSRSTGFPYVESLQYISEVEFIEIRAYVYSEMFLQEGTDSLVTLFTALFERKGRGGEIVFWRKELIILLTY